jgi:hypothetical protein
MEKVWACEAGIFAAPEVCEDPVSHKWACEIPILPSISLFTE